MKTSFKSLVKLALLVCQIRRLTSTTEAFPVRNAISSPFTVVLYSGSCLHILCYF